MKKSKLELKYIYSRHLPLPSKENPTLLHEYFSPSHTIQLWPSSIALFHYLSQIDLNGKKILEIGSGTSFLSVLLHKVHDSLRYCSSDIEEIHREMFELNSAQIKERLNRDYDLSNSSVENLQIKNEFFSIDDLEQNTYFPVKNCKHSKQQFEILSLQDLPIILADLVIIGDILYEETLTYELCLFVRKNPLKRFIIGWEDREWSGVWSLFEYFQIGVKEIFVDNLQEKLQEFGYGDREVTIVELYVNNV